VIPFKEREVDDAKLPTGDRVLSQRGIPGFKITRERVVRDSGGDPNAPPRRETTTDSYPPTTQVWRIGTGERSLKSDASDDEHPEYVVDEQLTLTQGPDIVD